MWKKITLIFSIIATLVGVGVGYGKLQSGQTETKKEVTEVKIVVKENTDKINENENKTIEHAAVIARTVAMLDKLEQRFYERGK